MGLTILNGDAREMCEKIEPESVQCLITSSPYWGLRDYGLPPSIWGGFPECEHEWGGAFCSKCGAWLGSLGLEPHPDMFAYNMTEIFRSIWKVMRKDGTVWLNLGDSYIGGGRGGLEGCGKGSFEEGRYQRGQKIGQPTGRVRGYKAKDLAEIPSLVVNALRADGWYLRSRIPWLKGSAMPESVTDRPAVAVEYIFLLSKSKKYFYDHEAVRLNGSIPAGTKAAKGSKERAAETGVNARPPEYKEYSGTRNRRNSDWFMDSLRDFLDRESGTLVHDHEGNPIAMFCNPQPYKGAHFAVFSPRLVWPMMLASTSPKACEHCGAPWKRVTEKKTLERYELPKDDPRYRPARYEGEYDEIKGNEGTGMRYRESSTIGWEPTCNCPNSLGTGKSVVLDPFAGTGTTMAVAEQLGLDSIGIELSAEYAKLIPERVEEING